MRSLEDMALAKSYLGCLYFNIMALSREVDKHAQEAFKPAGMSSSLGMLLMFVISNPEAIPKTLSDFFHLAPSTTTRLLDKLEKNSYIKRKYVRRNTYLFPTKKALELESKLHKCWQSLYTKLKGVMGEDKYTKCLQVIRTLV